MSGMQDALAKVAQTMLKNFGAAITFTELPEGTALEGHATEVMGRPETYERLQLIASQSATLMFTAGPGARFPELGSVCTWAGIGKWVVKEVTAIRPNGSNAACYVVLSR